MSRAKSNRPSASHKPTPTALHPTGGKGAPQPAPAPSRSPAAPKPVTLPTPAEPAAEPTDDQVRELAYHKWEAAGCPHGDGVQFWYEAEQELNRPG